MQAEYRTKVFKSGNSLALRLPKALGLREGIEMRVWQSGGMFSFAPAGTIRTIDVDRFWGKAPWLVRPEAHDSGQDDVAVPPPRDG